MVSMLHLRRARIRARGVVSVLTAVTVAGTLAACGGGSATPVDATIRNDALNALEVPASTPAIRGTVTHIVTGDSVAPAPSGGNASVPVSCPPSCTSTGRSLRGMLVEEIPGPIGSGGDKSMVTMLASARVLRRTAAGLEAASFADL